MMHRFVLWVWYWVASALAVIFIASGRVRRARKQAFAEGVISAIYFHKPNRRLMLRCIQWLRKHGYTFVSADDVIEMLKRDKPVPSGAVWLSFDDGWRELLTEVLPVVRPWRIPITLFIPSGIIEGEGKFPWLHDPGHPSYSPRPSKDSSAANSREAITLAELLTIASDPEVIIGSHTVSHPITPYCTDETLKVEIGESKRKLASWVGKPVNCFAYPEGKYDGRETRLLIQFGHELAVTTRSGFITKGMDCYTLPRLSVGDNTSFPQAICSMVGVWRPAVDRVKNFGSRALGRAEHLKNSRPACSRVVGSGN